MTEIAHAKPDLHPKQRHTSTLIRWLAVAALLLILIGLFYSRSVR